MRKHRPGTVAASGVCHSKQGRAGKRQPAERNRQPSVEDPAKLCMTWKPVPVGVNREDRSVGTAATAFCRPKQGRADKRQAGVRVLAIRPGKRMHDLEAAPIAVDREDSAVVASATIDIRSKQGGTDRRQSGSGVFAVGARERVQNLEASPIGVDREDVAIVAAATPTSVVPNRVEPTSVKPATGQPPSELSENECRI